MGQKPSRCLHFDCMRGAKGKHIYCDIHECKQKGCRAMIFGNQYCGEHMWKEYR